jgi:hypothetical protein
MIINIHIVEFWIMTTYSLVGGYQRYGLCSEALTTAQKLA